MVACGVCAFDPVALMAILQRRADLHWATHAPAALLVAAPPFCSPAGPEGSCCCKCSLLPSLQWSTTKWPLLPQSTGLADNTETLSATLVANGFNYSGKDFITSGITGAGRPACARPACTPPARSPVCKMWEQTAACGPDQCHLCSLACLSRASAL